MSTTLEELSPFLDARTGFKVDSGVRITLLQAGVEAFNGRASKAFELSGTTLDRVATTRERLALVLSALDQYLEGEAIRTSQNAFVVSNVAGRTDLQGIELALSKRRIELRKELDDAFEALNLGAIAGEAVTKELGETLDIANQNVAWGPPWGPPYW